MYCYQQGFSKVKEFKIFPTSKFEENFQRILNILTDIHKNFGEISFSIHPMHFLKASLQRVGNKPLHIGTPKYDLQNSISEIGSLISNKFWHKISEISRDFVAEIGDPS